jgi:transcriptional regulator
MLYIPPAFKIEDIDLLHDQIGSTGLSMVITVGDAGPLVSHVPLFLERKAGTFGKLFGHVARANPQVRLTKPEIPALAVIQGPDAYVSPGWYASK